MTMARLKRFRGLPLAIAGGLLLLLLVLAHLQWRWIGEVCTLERHRLKAALVMAGARLAEGVDREVMRVFAAFHPDFGAPADERLGAVSEQLERWRAEAPDPTLVAAVYRTRPDAGGSVLEQLQLQDRRFVPGPWPPELADLRAELREPAPQGQQPRALVTAGQVALIIPLGFPHPATNRADPLLGSVLLVVLDPHVLAGDLLPRVARDALGWDAGEDVTIAIIDAARPGRAIYRSDPAAATDRRDAELCVRILAARPGTVLHHPWASRGASHRRASSAWPHPDAVAGCGEAALGWHLLARRRGRSIEEAVASLRVHNLAASLGILGLLASTAIVLVATTQRAQRLARQQLEFVAGVTHELHTPLAAIRAAGENLADGVVADPAQVRRYGGLIAGEGRRLSTMVAQLLELAGIQSGRRAYRFEALEVGELVDGALHESRLLLAEAGVAVDRDLPHGLHVRADVGALRRVLRNLLENAIKHGGQGRWLGVRARGTAVRVELEIADRGPGIPRDEVPHLFEPFFRGRDAAEAGVPGVGLGLAMVRQIIEAHGGSVSIASESVGPERGTTVTLHLPAAPAAPPSSEASA